MADDTESPRAARMFEAVQGLERRLSRRVTLDELGAWVAEREGRSDDPYAGSVVRRWLKGLSEPRGSQAWEALADVLEVEPGWLVWGRGPKVLSPPAPAAPAGPLLPARTAQVLRADDESPATKARRARTRRAEGS